MRSATCTLSAAPLGTPPTGCSCEFPMPIVVLAAACMWCVDAPPLAPADASRVSALVQAAKSNGNAVAGAKVFANPKNACLSCHKLGPTGGDVGPALDVVGNCLTPNQ